MAGYHGYSMSNNAVAAYENGEMPMSKWSKKAIIERIEEAIDDGDIELQCSLDKLKKLPLEFLKRDCLTYSSWHHTSKFYNETDFYSLDIDSINEMTDEYVNMEMSYYKDRRRRLRSEKTPEERAEERIRKAERKAEREAEKALKAEMEILFKYQKRWRTLKGFMKSKNVDLDKLRKVRKKMIAERREELRKIWERQGNTYGLSHIEEDDFVEYSVKGLLPR